MKTIEQFKIIHLGHLGVGGAFGISPIDKEQNRQQKWLRKVWEEAKQIIGIPNRYPEILVLGGEIIEGVNPKNGGENITSGWRMTQIEDAVSCIKEWVGKETQEILLLYAHTYHGSQEFRVETVASDKLKVEFPNKKNNIVADTHFDKLISGKVLRFIHGGSGATIYLSSANERTLKSNLQQSALGKTYKVDQIYEYHGHRVAGATLEQVGSIWCPCFKFTDTVGQMRNPDGWRPDIGIMITTFEDRFGATRINNDTILFVPPFEYNDLEKERIRFNAEMIKIKKANRLPLSPQLPVSVRIKENLGTLEPNYTLSKGEIKNEVLNQSLVKHIVAQ